jgi:thiol:disulfide interchange protein
MLQNGKIAYNRNVRILGILALFLLPLTTYAEEPLRTKATLLIDKATIAPGEAFDAGILLEMDPGWHTYYKDPGESGMATSITWKLPEGFTAGEIRWPPYKSKSLAGIQSNVYEDKVLLPVRIQTPKTFTPSQEVSITAVVNWLECEDICVPGSATLSHSIHFASESKPAASEILALFDQFRNASGKSSTSAVPSEGAGAVRGLISGTETTLFAALLGGFIGGLILNLMPCVLPVIAIKILSFVKQGQENPARVRRLGYFFGLGVLVSFWVLAAAVIFIQTAGSQIGWGFQFQNPYFILAMAIVVTFMALNFFGIFEIHVGGAAINQAGQLATREGAGGAFWNGVLATTLATPCTAPFLAPALGFAFSQPAHAILLVFTAIGLGLALPYMILSMNPALVKKMPKPGTWMHHFKVAMGFPMVLTAIWLLWILGAAYGNHAAMITGGWLTGIAFAVWLAAVLGGGKILPILTAILLMGTGAFLHIPTTFASAEELVGTGSNKSLINWQPFSRAALEEALKGEGIVFVDFTAKWCLTCQVNKKTSLEVPEVAAKFKEKGVVAFMADWTRSDPEITEALKSFGRRGVPLYVVYPKDRSKGPVLLPEVLTPSIVMDAVER